MKTFLALNFIFTITSSAFAASYEVPVNKELKAYAMFELPSFSKIEKDGKIVVKYDLPNVLTGAAEEIILEADNYAGLPDFILKGEKGTAKCKVRKPITECKIEYTNLIIDEEAAAAAISKISTHAQEVNKRLEVMRAFSTDPVGIVHY